MLFLVVYLVCGIGTCYYTILTTLSDPTDPTVAEERSFRYQYEKGDKDIRFDTSTYDFYCAVCNTHVLEDSKHCKKCNRCAQLFDHHCNIVNNDIGVINYRLFAWMIGVAFIFLLFSLGIDIYALVVFCAMKKPTDVWNQA